MENGASSDEEECLLPDEEGGVLVDGIYIPPPTKPYYELEIKGPRLIITRIENNFFKSYAQSQILGPFHKVLLSNSSILVKLYIIVLVL